MSVQTSDFDRFWSREEYRAWCAAQPKGRFERVDGRIIKMVAERGAHLRVKDAIYVALRQAIKAAGLDCQALPDGATIETGDNDYEPDAVVNCGPRIADDEIAAPNPIIIVEVLSPGTQSTDTGGKLAGYFMVPSVMHYLIVHPTKRVVTHHRRVGNQVETLPVVNGPISLGPPGIAVEVEAFYAAD